jgi:hypothetical protein
LNPTSSPFHEKNDEVCESPAPLAILDIAPASTNPQPLNLLAELESGAKAATAQSLSIPGPGQTVGHSPRLLCLSCSAALCASCSKFIAPLSELSTLIRQTLGVTPVDHSGTMTSTPAFLSLPLPNESSGSEGNLKKSNFSEAIPSAAATPSAPADRPKASCRRTLQLSPSLSTPILPPPSLSSDLAPLEGCAIPHAPNGPGILPQPPSFPGFGPPPPAPPPDLPRAPETPMGSKDRKNILKRLHWSPVKKAIFPNWHLTLWHSMMESPALDLTDFEEAFAATIEKKIAAKSTRTKKAKATFMLDDKRERAMSICLAVIKLNPKQIVCAITSLDKSQLCYDFLTSLQEVFPTSDEIAMAEPFLNVSPRKASSTPANRVDSQDGLGSNSSLAQQWVLCVAQSERISGITATTLKRMLDVFIFEHELVGRVARIEDSITTVQKAFAGLGENRVLRMLLGLVLQLGNRMNFGTPRGGAIGFGLACLEKLKYITSQDNSTTVLHYCARQIELRCSQAEIDSFTVDLSACTLALRVEEGDIAKELESLHERSDLVDLLYRDLTNECESLLGRSVSNDILNRVKHLSEASKYHCMDQNSRLSKLRETYQTLKIYFGIAKPDMVWSELFGIWSRFGCAFDQAHMDLEIATLMRKRKLTEDSNSNLSVRKTKHQRRDSAVKDIPDAQTASSP